MRFLHDVVGIDARAKFRVNAQMDDAFEVGPMSLEQPIHRRRVITVADAVDQLAALGRVGR
jgi:hypothetical protein